MFTRHLGRQSNQARPLKPLTRCGNDAVGLLVIMQPSKNNNVAGLLGKPGLACILRVGKATLNLTKVRDLLSRSPTPIVSRLLFVASLSKRLPPIDVTTAYLSKELFGFAPNW